MGVFNMEKSMLGFSKGSMHWIPNCRDSKHAWRCRTAGLLNPGTSSRFFLLTEQKGLVALPVFKLCRGCPSWSFSLLVPGTQSAVGKMRSEQSVLLFGRRKFDKQRILQFGFWRLCHPCLSLWGSIWFWSFQSPVLSLLVSLLILSAGRISQDLLYVARSANLNLSSKKDWVLPPSFLPLPWVALQVSLFLASVKLVWKSECVYF